MNYKKSNGLNYILISDTALFHGCSPVETEKLLSGMQFFTKAYKKGVPVYHAGTPYLISELFCTVLFRLKIMTSGETKISSALPRPEKFLQKHMPVFPENP